MDTEEHPRDPAQDAGIQDAEQEAHVEEAPPGDLPSREAEGGAHDVQAENITDMEGSLPGEAPNTDGSNAHNSDDIEPRGVASGEAGEAGPPPQALNNTDVSASVDTPDESFRVEAPASPQQPEQDNAPSATAAPDASERDAQDAGQSEEYPSHPEDHPADTADTRGSDLPAAGEDDTPESSEAPPASGTGDMPATEEESAGASPERPGPRSPAPADASGEQERAGPAQVGAPRRSVLASAAEVETLPGRLPRKAVGLAHVMGLDAHARNNVHHLAEDVIITTSGNYVVIINLEVGASMSRPSVEAAPPGFVSSHTSSSPP